MKYAIRAGICLLTIILSFASVTAQLTDNDIRALQEQGKAEGWTFTITKNPATQYSLDQITGFKVPDNWRELGPSTSTSVTRALPSAFDWRTEANGMPPIRNQLSCGSCWAFATVGVFECNIKIKDQTVVDLSEQWLVSCNRNGYSCDGGWWCHHYFLNTTDRCNGTGAVMESEFPYTWSNGTCGCPYPHEYFIDGWGYVSGQYQIPSEDQMKQAIMDHGPIGVGVAANAAFQAYGGGVFNGCTGGPINHAVVLVGWDDAQGVWILRNSWGPYWGEGGYMRIPYGCQEVGYNATYIDYRGRLAVQSDTQLGRAPLSVGFSINTALQVNSCVWDFGDGNTSTETAPTHVYPQPGLYSVSLTAQCPDGTHISQKSDYIAVYADSLVGQHVNGSPGQQVRLDISARNYLPLSEMIIPMVWGGAMGLNFDSASTVGLRTNGLGATGWIHVDPYTYGRGTFRVAPAVGENQLPAGDGPVVSLFFTIPDYPTATENPISIEAYDDGMKFHNPEFTASSGTYTPTILSAAIAICKAGDVSNNGFGPDLTDLSFLVSYLTGLTQQLPNPANANVNGKGLVDLADLSTLVSYLTTGSPAPKCP
ncbi:hypothetical protein C3F09_02110 [candidate division GN15 bacterium]|uniref:PKD domain-containing protein n=1 Tax=candidate division GN15 bacterium TaxID=2072418 RepID=A0A855XCI7_9BACT|nr:MAG: hypothetical protein C3F09_02110 [candidate division GN15 bacterium]